MVRPAHAALYSITRTFFVDMGRALGDNFVIVRSLLENCFPGLLPQPIRRICYPGKVRKPRHLLVVEIFN